VGRSHGHRWGVSWPPTGSFSWPPSAIGEYLAGIEPSEDAWASIERRIRRSGRRASAQRLSVVAFALLLSAAALVGLWIAFSAPRRSMPSAGPTPSEGPGATASPSPAASASPAVGVTCSESSADGDFDGDGAVDRVTLGQIVPPGDRCPGTDRDSELTLDLGSGERRSAPFGDRQGPCRLLAASDLDGDGASELLVGVGPGAAVSYTRVYRLQDDAFVPVELAPPGDPRGGLEAGPIMLGGPRDATLQGGFYCEEGGDGTRVVVAWRAEWSGGAWNVHLTDLELEGGAFVVVDSADRVIADGDGLPSIGDPVLPPPARPCP